MPKLPIVSGLEVLKVLRKQGFIESHRSGRHVTAKKKINGTLIVVVPLKNELGRGVLMSILRQSGMERNDFLKFFE